MFLKKKIASSSLAEVVIALAVIALCFGVAAQIFTRSVMVTNTFDDVRQQTELQSKIWKQLQELEGEVEIENVQLETEADQVNDSLLVDTYLGTQGRIIWQQHRLKNE